MSGIAKFFLILIAPIFAILLALLGLATLRTNPLGWFLVLVGVAYTAGVFIVFYIRREQFWEGSSGGKTMHEERGDRSYWWMVLGMMSAFYIPPIEYQVPTAFIPRLALLKASGVGLVTLGVLLLVWARRSLGGSYSGHLSVKEGQALVRRGPYHWIRHPAYTGYLLMALGVSLGYASLIGLVAITILLFPALVYRIKAEERILLLQFAEAYQRYSRATKALIPGLW